jgi:hypothetical protein
MYFRCTDCYAATWIQVTDTSLETQTLGCRGCGRGFSVPTAGNFDGEASEQYETALALAEGNGFDLPTSYSVVLGIMTLEHAMTLQARGIPAQEIDPKPEQPARPVGAEVETATSAATSQPMHEVEESAASALEYDPAFAEAVAQGYLPVQQAIERGDRERYVKRLIDRHGLSRSLALMVADNKTSLTMALRKDREEVAEILRPMKVASWKKALGAAVAGLAVVAVGIYGIRVWSGIEQETRKVEEWAETVSTKAEKERTEEMEAQAREPKRTVPQRRVRILRDDEGRMLEIEGPDPSSILLAYCSNQDPDDRYRPVELTVPDPPWPGTKLGVFTDEAEMGKRYAIKIRRTIKGRRWIAGDGQRPISATEAPMRSEDKAAVPVLVNRDPTSDS